MILNISVIVHTFNEEVNIGACLQSVLWADEIILIDNYSTDNTLQIAKKYTNNTFLFPKSEHVEPSRNFGLDKARSEWLLSMDADETLPRNAEKIIRKLIQNKKIDGYWLPRKQHINNSTFLHYGYFYPDYQLRLFRNRKDIRYSGKIHEFPFIAKTVRLKEPHILHNSTHSKFSSFMAFIRSFTYIKIEGREMSKRKINIVTFLKRSITEIFRHLYRSFVVKKGYKDGYNGFRAALLYGLYKGFICFYAVIIRLKEKFN